MWWRDCFEGLVIWRAIFRRTSGRSCKEMEPSHSPPTTPMQKSRSSPESFDAGSVGFRGLEDESPGVAGVNDVDGGFSLGEGYNVGASYNVNGSYNASGTGTGSSGGGRGGGKMVRGLVIKAACLIGGAFLLRRLTKSTTRWDHARTVARSLSGEKVSRNTYRRSSW